ncbi:MAG: beta-galactosidase trimerization domain-containing protein [Opitutus sp.]
MNLYPLLCAALLAAPVSAAPAQPPSTSNGPAADPYLHQLYDTLNDSPMQERLRALRPWPVGVVFIQRPGMTLADMRSHFRLMKELGFTCLKQLELVPGQDAREVYHAALDEGINPWWYDDASGELPSPELLKSLDLPADLSPASLRTNPVWRARQESLLRARVDHPEPYSRRTGTDETDGLPGTLKREQYGISPESVELFTEWLHHRYTEVDTLKQAWNFQYALIRRRQEWANWSDVQQNVLELVNSERQEYRRIVDVYRFRADAHLAMLKKSFVNREAHNPLIPERRGGEMSLFLPFAARSTDMEGIASLMAAAGSFYPSMHPGWHYEEADFEFARPSYMQSALAVDWFKGGWAATWESTGGPQQLSGGKAPFVPEVRDQVAGFTVDENTIQQLMLTWVAAGFKGFGLWCWNARAFGWEAGEYALLDRNMRPNARTIAAGKIGQATQRLRDELWTAHKEPLVGVFQDWESDAFWAAVGISGRDMYKQMPVRARIGASRALINANIPWEHVTARNLRAGLADRYRAILLPAQLAIDAEVLVLLRQYVERGGRVILDAPGAWYGYDGRLLPTSDGSAFEQLFGCRIGDFQYSRANHTQWSVGKENVDGFIMELQPTGARVLETFSDGRPAVTEHKVGQGTAVVVAYAASLNCWKPGHAWMERSLVRYALGEIKPSYTAEGAIVYRLATPAADHYFIVNDQPVARDAQLHCEGFGYKSATDAVWGGDVELGGPIPIPANGARWIRAVR